MPKILIQPVLQSILYKGVEDFYFQMAVAISEILYLCSPAVLELTLQARLSLNSQRAACLCLPGLELKACAVTTTWPFMRFLDHLCGCHFLKIKQSQLRRKLAKHLEESFSLCSYVCMSRCAGVNPGLYAHQQEKKNIHLGHNDKSFFFPRGGLQHIKVQYGCSRYLLTQQMTFNGLLYINFLL